MKTVLLSLREAGGVDAVAYGLRLLREGAIIALPTDTVYGLAADPFNEEAVQKLFSVKARRAKIAIPLLLADMVQLDMVVSAVPMAARRLMAVMWPGALTIVLLARPILPAKLLAGGDTVAVRLPDAPVVRQLAHEMGRPLAVTSANRAGLPPAQSAGEVISQLGGRIPLLLDGGPAKGGAPSTIVDLSGSEVKFLRPGPISWEAIRQLLSDPNPVKPEPQKTDH